MYECIPARIDTIFFEIVRVGQKQVFDQIVWVGSNSRKRPKQPAVPELTLNDISGFCFVPCFAP
jgi:hypothetical protein